MEIIDLGINDLEPLSLNIGQKQSVNFGPGIELLMNDKKKSSSSNNINIDLGELNKLEDELNELSGNGFSSSNTPKQSSETKTLSGFAANLFNFGGNTNNSNNISTVQEELNDSKLGYATAESVGNTSTWDGFAKMSEVPLSSSSAPKMNDREKRRKKRAMIKKIDEWYEKGILKHNSHFNIDSNYEEVEDEYETALEDKRKKDSVKLQGWWFMTFVNSIEYANTAFNPFDLNLDGWGEQISEDLDSYEEIFSELHDKYKGGKLSPEISLLLRLGFSAAVVNITNKALSTATPGFNDVIRQSPELMKMFTSATVQSMSQQSPGFSMANNIASGQGYGQGNGQGNGPSGINNTFGPPPAPVETKNHPPSARPSMQYTEHPGNRPDISASRGAMFREQGVDVNNNQDNFSRQSSAIPIQASNTGARPEMRGPQNTDINNILAGLKTREVVTNESTSNQEDNDSMISISSLKDMQNSNMPKRTNRRKQRSDKNVVSLDI